MNIFVVDDDEVLADGLRRVLRAAGYGVECSTCGESADLVLSRQAFDLVILDLGLPRLSGLEVLARLRSRASSIPVLVLTCASEVSDRVVALDEGADDVMAKPFALAELEARIRALLRRRSTSTSTRSWIQRGELSFDVVGRMGRARAGECSSHAAM